MESKQLLASLSLDRSVKCLYCNKNYKNSKTLSAHLYKYHHSDGNKCQTCDGNNADDKASGNHKLETDNCSAYTCNECGKSGESPTALRFQAQKSVSVIYSEGSYACYMTQCDRTFQTETFLARRKQRGHANNDDRVPRYMCEHCGYRTSVYCNFVVHKRTHTAEKPFCCDKCGKCFRALYQLTEHKLIHSLLRAYKCDICAAAFRQSKTLLHHKKLHSSDKEFVCGVCDKSYAQSSGISQHMRLHKERNKINK